MKTLFVITVFVFAFSSTEYSTQKQHQNFKIFTKFEAVQAYEYAPHA